MRRGIAELNGEGETVGGIVVVRYGANAREVIQRVKKRLDQAMKGLPPDVTYTVAYDRTALIDRAVATLERKLVEESIVVALVCIAFLLHFRSALVAIIILPIAVLISFLVMFGQGISSNIMSLGGIAIAIGAMVDAVDHHDRERAQAHRARTRAKSRIGRSSATRRSKSARRCSIRCWSSRFRSCPCSRCKRRKAGCSSLWPSPRPIRWQRRRCSPSRSRRF